MRSKLRAGALAGLLAGVLYGVIMQATTSPMPTGGETRATTSSMPATGSEPQRVAPSMSTGGDQSQGTTPPPAMDGGKPLIMMVAKVVRSESLAVAWIVLLLVGVVMGCLFGVVLGDRISSVGEGLGWGALYGVFWWVPGTLVLMPILLGMSAFAPLTMAPMRFGAMVSLLGYLLGGLLLGAVFAALRRPHPIR